MSPLCAAKPECRNLSACPSIQHSSRPAAQRRPCLRPTPDAAHRGRESARCPRRSQTARTVPSDESRGDGTDPTTHCRRDTRSHWPRRSREELAAGHRAPAFASPFRRAKQVRKRQRRRDCRTAHVHDRLVMRVVMPSACESAARWRTRPSAQPRHHRCQRSATALPATSSWPRRSSSGRTASRRRRARGRSRRGCGVLWRQRHRAGDPRANLRHPFGDLAS